MMLRTPCPIPALPHISHGEELAWMGSCFSEQLALHLTRLGFNMSAPSHGILFDGYSMVRAMNQWLQPANERLFSLVNHQGRWYSWDHHGSFSHSEKKLLENLLQSRANKQIRKLKKGRVLYLTLGTAWYFVLKKEQRPIANCHQLPGDLFSRHLAEPQELMENLTQGLLALKRSAPQLQVVCSVSPVKHLRDGLSGNLLSKSVLLLVADAVCRDLDFCHYFPAYEILTEELRDYRFYGEDMAHPSGQAVKYIMDLFSQVSFSEETKKIAAEVDRLRHFEAHRPRFEKQNHRKAIADKRNALKKIYPQIRL